MNYTTYAYLTMPQLSLSILINQDFKLMYEIEREIEKDWIKNSKCECVKTLRKDCVLNCKHINREIEEKTKEIRKRIKMKSSVSVYRALSKIQSS